MSINFKIFLIFLLIYTISCTTGHQLQSKKVIRDGIEMLYGETSRQQLFFDYPEWEIEYNSYKLEQEQIDSLKNLVTNEYKIDIFLGTWCSDSRREVPRFYKILDETQFLPANKINLFAVDRSKKLDDGSAEQNGINRVTTFIFRKDQQEVGRIIEYPQKNLESDIIRIIQNN